jgi:two-component system probable response regulator PhcQ
MKDESDYRKFAILYVDDEEKSLKMFAQAFERNFRIFTAPSAAEGWRVLEQHHAGIGLLMTDQRMPGEKGVQLLEKVRQQHPHIIRILTTAYADIEAAVSAVNSGAIYKYITKPWEAVELEQVLRRGLQFFQVQHERDQLLREKVSNLHRLMIADRIISLGILSAGLSHHIRNSLVAVRTFMDLAPAKLEEERGDLEQLRDPGYWRGFYDQVQGQIERITSMLGDLGIASDQSPCHFSSDVRLDQLLAEALAAAREKLQTKGIEVLVQCDPGLPPLHADAVKLRRLFDLLLADEIISVPAGGRISITASAQPFARPEEAEIKLEIQDTGPGLTAEALRSVFDPFFIRADDPHELGINLMACYFIVHHHGGRIEVQNRNPGATFQIFLPLHEQPAPISHASQDYMKKVLMNNELWEKLLADRP